MEEKVEKKGSVGAYTPKSIEDMHWAEIIAQKIVDTKKPPFVVTSGATTSGPAHLGTVCEFLYPYTIKEALENLGFDAKVVFVADILDALDSVPYELKSKEEFISKEIGKPLCTAADPLGCHASFGEHYLSQVEEAIEFLGVDIKVERADRLYLSGAFDNYAKIFLEKENEVKEIIAQTSGRSIDSLKDWSPIMPICQNCGRISTTKVTFHDSDSYEYECTACGYKGKNKLKDHKYKLQWRLHWPAWQSYFNSSAEGGGGDHFTKGGSWDTAVAIHKQIFNREPPVGYKFGLFLFKGKKYSKSKGVGVTTKQLFKLVPKEVVKYFLIVPDLQENKDFDPTGEKLISLYNDLERISKIEPKNRAEKKKKIAFLFGVKKLSWKAPFVDILLRYQIYKDWEKVGEALNDHEGVKYLAPYIEEWIKEGYAPERYIFNISPNPVQAHKDAVEHFKDSLKEGMNEEEIHSLVYEVAKRFSVPPEELFAQLYTAIIGKPYGPRFGKLVYAVGIKKIQSILSNSLALP